MGRNVDKTDVEWQQQLTPQQYQVCRQKGTEPAFTGEYHAFKEAGTYRCVCCGEPVVQFERKVRFRHGLAELLAAGRPGGSRDRR
jgi:peptide-methionine (R)-S-oxide reductase